MVVQSETLSVESWGMTSTDSSLYRSSESDYCSILDPIPVADAQVPEPAVLQSEVQGADAVEGADDMDPRGMPEVSLNAVQESAAENSDLEDAASATIDGVVPGGLQPFIPPLLQSSPIRQGSSECAVELESVENLEDKGISPVQAAAIPAQWRSPEALELQAQLVRDLSSSPQDFGLQSLWMEPGDQIATTKVRH